MAKEVCYLQCWFEGHVQGVGFRYMTAQVAKGFEVNGTVQNLSDGRVLLEAEGSQEEVQAFQQEVEEQMRSYVRDTQVKTTRREATFQGFSIKG